MVFPVALTAEEDTTRSAAEKSAITGSFLILFMYNLSIDRRCEPKVIL
jgi:hypothetical protein